MNNRQKGGDGMLNAPPPNSSSRKKRRQRNLGIFGVISLIGSTFLGSAPAHAAAGDPFDPDSPTIFIVQGSPAQLQRAETSGDGTYAFSDEGSPRKFAYNAIGFNPADNYIYGIVQSTENPAFPLASLIRVGQDGVATRVGNRTYSHPGGAANSTRFFVGDFNPEDGYYYIADSGPNSTILVLNASNGNVVRTIQLSSALQIQDFTFKDGYAWGASADGELKRVNLSNGVITTYPGVLPAAPGGYGAAWVFGNGNLGFSANTSGNIVQLELSNTSAAKPTTRVVSVSPGPSSSLNDGTSIPGRPADLSILKSAPAEFVSGEKIEYEITVTNNGPGTSSGWTVSDTLPSGLSNPSVEGDGNAEISAGTVTLTGGRLPAGSSSTFTITADTDVEPGACLNNTAIVTGNEADDNSDNNESSAESCAVTTPALALAKSSDASADSRPGDTVTYTVTATNTGTADYTQQNPAVVFDDLSAVLDDADFNDDATASRPGTVSHESPLLSWTGALPVGESIQLTYSTTLKSGGDGEIRNVAWVPSDPENPEPPQCDPADENGLDPESGEPCAVIEAELPKLSIEKSADRSDLPAVGQSATYTIVVTNEGPGGYTSTAPASMSDDLSDVLDDASLEVDSLVASVGQVSVTDGTLAWEGPLAAGESATITYSVSYHGGGNQVLNNRACVPDAEVAAGAEPCATVAIPAANLDQWKSVVSSEDPAVAGSELVYTLFFENTGQAEATVDAVDLLNHVLDDADVTVEPVSNIGTLSATRNNEVVSVQGTLAPGETAEVTYTVTVKADGERGDDVSANFLFPNDPENPPVVPEAPTCEPTNADRPECTTTPIGAIEYSKTVESSDNPIRAGTILTYVVEIRSTGMAAMPVSREDVLTDVLDDATLASQPSSDVDTVTVSEVEEDRFSIGGSLPGGATATITYTVTVNEQNDRGNNSANNFLVPPGQTPPESCEDGSTDCTVTPLPNLDVAKSVDPASGTAVAPGQTLTYTLKF
ncbi:DUF11 domain-containing protein, partial [Glutamicibacter protophormiae]|uniref:DUF11 domain-containing protein n=1 Tax=Glutamicibacter protophormiae TaxID=37930 RepID=UPI003325DB26